MAEIEYNFFKPWRNNKWNGYNKAIGVIAGW